MPKVSIIMPVLNEEEIIENTLISIKNQTFRDFELIVVDNGCTDKTIEIANNYADIILKEKKKGSIVAFHKGVTEAKGEIIVDCDADTFYPNTWLEKIVNTFNNNKRIVAIYGPMGFIEDNRFVNFFNILFYCIFDFLSSKLFKIHIAGLANIAFLKSAYFKVGGFDTKSNLASQDFILLKKMDRIGKVIFKYNIFILTSNRRFKGENKLKMLKKSFSFWADVAFKLNKKTYNEYYDEEYYKRKGGRS